MVGYGYHGLGVFERVQSMQMQLEAHVLWFRAKCIGGGGLKGASQNVLLTNRTLLHLAVCYNLNRKCAGHFLLWHIKKYNYN